MKLNIQSFKTSNAKIYLNIFCLCAKSSNVCLYGFKSIRRTYTGVSRQPSCHLEVVTALPTTKFDDSLIDAVEGFGYLFTSGGGNSCTKFATKFVNKRFYESIYEFREIHYCFYLREI